MARKFWVVFSENLMPMFEGYHRGQLLLDKPQREDYGFFFEKKLADSFAQQLSARYPGQEIQVAEAVYGFHSPQPVKATRKVWNEQGEYILV